jgi:hypothetical protein
MRSRASLILVLLLAVAVRVIPCDAMPVPAMSQHDCCDPSACPDGRTPDHGTRTPASQSDACCTVSDARSRQQDSRLLTAVVTVAPPERLTDFFPLSPVANAPANEVSPPAHSAPLHLLFSVLLV